MKENFVFTHSIPPQELTPNIKETLRYSGYKNVTTSFIQTLSDKEKELATCAQEKISQVMSPKSVFIKLPILALNNLLSKSTSLSKNLADCKSVYLFAATLGPKVDLLIQQFSKIDTALAVFMQGAGAMYIEEYCDFLQNYFMQCEETQTTTLAPRFSPGYGDVSLSTQKLFFDLLKPEKIGLTLNDTFLMSPEKSVTAFVGVRGVK